MKMRGWFGALALALSACAPAPAPPPAEPFAVVKFMTDQALEPNSGISVGGYRKVAGFTHVTFHVQFTQKAGDELPVDLGFIFAFDSAGTMGSRRFVDLEHAATSPQHTQFVEVSGAGAWHGEQGISSYSARSPVTAPFAQVFLYNRAPIARRASVWAYLTR